MLNDMDAEFHLPDPAEPTWAETNFFGFYNAAAHLNVGVYALFRTNLGVVSSAICINSRRAVTPWQADFCDIRAALPIPAARSLLDYELLNSLHVRCLEPNREWTVAYDDGEGTSIDVAYSALMPPFDIHDPAMDPMCASGSTEGKFAWGTAYNGHFDQTGRFRGEVAVRGRKYPIDCISTMDHSWGPRPERGIPSMSWLHAHFGEDFAVHAILVFDAERNANELSLAHGYVLERGKVWGLASGAGTVERDRERYPDNVRLELTDSRGRCHELAGEALTSFPWQFWPNLVSFNVLAQWRCGDRKGFGEIQDVFELPQLNRLNSGLTTARASHAGGS